jgi:DNA-binding NarL/FixJ family response regulator
MHDSPEPQVKARLLVVEDHDLVAESLRRALGEEDDLEVVGVVDTVRAAVRAAVDLQPDAVVMDYFLPDGTGTEATALIKQVVPQTMIVMLTGQATGPRLSDALDAGCTGFVTKEGPFVDLVGAVRAALAGEVRAPAHLREEDLGRPPTGSGLSARVLEVLGLLAGGRATSEIAEDLHLSIHTVRNHVRNILTKLSARTRLEAVAVATRQGLLDRG